MITNKDFVDSILIKYLVSKCTKITIFLNLSSCHRLDSCLIIQRVPNQFSWQTIPK
jgi:hypothetical protein